MNGYRENWGRLLLVITIIFVVLCILVMVVNLYKAPEKAGQSVDFQKLKPMAQPISYIKYENLIKGFKETYIPVGVHKRNIFSKSRVTTGQEKEPEITIPTGKYNFEKLNERLYVAKIYKRPVKLLFKGYIQLTDGTYVATINWAGKTDFKKVGDEIRGYKVVDFKKEVSERKTLWGGTEKIDQSIITLERETGERFNLEIGKITLEKEIYARIRDRKEMKSYEVYIGSEILGNKVLDISPSQVIISTQNGERIYLTKES